jgi:hypothetical protein
MKQQLALLLTLLTVIYSCDAQIQPVKVQEKKSSNNQYKDFVIDKDRLWALTTDGKLTIFDVNTGDPLTGQVENASAIIVLTKDKHGDIIIGDESKSIKKYDKSTNSWTTLYKFSNTLLGITFDSKNNCYLLTNKGVFDNASKKMYYPGSAQNPQIRHTAGWLRTPVYITDKNDNIWLGFGYGEWGGDLFIFNTIDKKFIVPELKDFPITLNPIKSIFESPGNVFVSSGLMHFSTSGCIVKFDKFQSQIIFESEEHKKFPDDSTNYETIAGEYIGPGTYNPDDSCIYFYSQNGIFKGNHKNDLSKIESWTKVLQPKLHWTNGQPDAVGSPMNVLKLQFLNPDKLAFLSQVDGIGIYDGKTLIMTK